jgi:hypothetical protein
VQAVLRHAGGGLILLFWQTPNTSGHWEVAVQDAIGGLLHLASMHSVLVEHGLPCLLPELLSQVPLGHCELKVQVAPFWHVPPLTGQSPPVLHDFAEQRPLPGQLVLFVHAVAPSGQVFWLQAPGMAAHCALEVHDVFAGLLQMPQSVSNRQTGFGMVLHVPALGQSVFLLQAPPLLLHLPPMIAQSLADAQRLPAVLQWPTLEQSDCCMQLAPLTLQAPGCAGQAVLALAAVQLALVMLQVPGSGVQTGGAQVVTGVHGFSGSGGSRLQPGGL